MKEHVAQGCSLLLAPSVGPCSQPHPAAPCLQGPPGSEMQGKVEAGGTADGPDCLYELKINVKHVVHDTNNLILPLCIVLTLPKR